MDEGTIGTERLLLTPLDAGDADELVGVLADPGLHEFIGDRPATLEELRTRFAAMTAGSGRADELWRNWVVRRRADGQAVGTVQATLSRRQGGWRAEVAWVVGLAHQGQGYAADAARALVAAGRARVGEVVAHIPRPRRVGPGRRARRAQPTTHGSTARSSARGVTGADDPAQPGQEGGGGRPDTAARAGARRRRRGRAAARGRGPAAPRPLPVDVCGPPAGPEGSAKAASIGPALGLGWARPSARNVRHARPGCPPRRAARQARPAQAAPPATGQVSRRPRAQPNRR